MKNEANLLKESINDGFRRPDHAVVFENGEKVINTCEADCLYSVFWMGPYIKVWELYEQLIINVEKDVVFLEKDQEFKEDTVCALWEGTDGIALVGMITSRSELVGLNSLLDRFADKEDIIQVVSFDTQHTPWTVWDRINQEPQALNWKQSAAQLFSKEELKRVKSFDLDSVREIELA